MDWTAVAIAFISGGAGGTLIGLFKPLVDWNIEKKRVLFQERKNLINNFRESIESINILAPDAISANAAFRRIEKYLSDKELDDLDKLNSELAERVNVLKKETDGETFQTETVQEDLNQLEWTYMMFLRDVATRIEKRYKLL